MTMPSLGNLGQISTNQATTPAASGPAEANKIEDPADAPTAQAVRNNPFTEDQLNDAWAGLSVHFPGEERLIALITTQTPQLIAPNLCRITVANPWQKEDFQKFGKKVMDIVRDKLGNDLLKLQVEISKQEVTRRAYTASEKYKVLADMNPHIAELRKRMNLQLE